MSEEEFENRLKMYVLVRKDCLTDQQVGVQAAHAIQEYNTTYPQCPELLDWASNHKTLIFLSASEKELGIYTDMFEGKHASFCESDLDGLLTATAFEPITHAKGREIFGNLQLV